MGCLGPFRTRNQSLNHCSQTLLWKGNLSREKTSFSSEHHWLIGSFTIAKGVLQFTFPDLKSWLRHFAHFESTLFLAQWGKIRNHLVQYTGTPLYGHLVTTGSFSLVPSPYIFSKFNPPNTDPLYGPLRVLINGVWMHCRLHSPYTNKRYWSSWLCLNTLNWFRWRRRRH